jgi:pre-mRNA-splicing factor 18
MDLLKRELHKKRKAVREDFAGKSFVRRSELEQKRLQKRGDEHPKAGAPAPSLESAAAAASDPISDSDPYAAAGNLNPASRGTR